jgi:hypothetical protein
MIPETESSRNNISRWGFFFCILIVVVACGEDEPVSEQEEQEVTATEEKVLRVREWYPTPKYAQQRPIMVAPVQPEMPSQYTQQPRQYNTTPMTQTWGGGQATYQQFPAHPVPQDGVAQSWRQPAQQPVQAQPATPGTYYQYGAPPQNVQRPWGAVPEPKQHGYPGGYNNIWQPARQSQQWTAPAQDTQPIWENAAPYGVPQSYGPGYVW